MNEQSPQPTHEPTPRPSNDAPPTKTYVSRGGLKLHHALHAFGVSPAGHVCIDMGASTGGFTDCLLQHGALRVHAIDTAYGELAWKLRNDPRVVVIERTNALRAQPTERAGIIVADLGWTTQRRLVPVAMSWLAATSSVPPPLGIITLIKPHYECKDLGEELPRGAILPEDRALAITQRVIQELTTTLPLTLKALTPSPVLGGASANDKKSKGTGNREWLAWLA
jgi:23S rRNA (cytidine1920-2'-O)/16S rRNA (cytidine1409-2'-O)-methyltransferase